MAKKEEIAHLAEKLMNTRENIRNMGIVAHIDHGKCVSGKSRLFLAGGETVEAEQLFAQSALSGEKVVEDAEKTVFELRKPVETFSIDKDTGRVEAKKISHAWKLKGGKTVRLKLENSFEISTTPEHKYLLFVGTIQPRKNLQRLIEAFAILKAQNPMLKLVIAGKLGWMYDEVLAAPKKWGVEDKVVFTGYINEAERNSLLRNALVYIQSSITEGFGLPVLEAMAAGIPVVSSNGGALAEIVGDAGLLFDPLDVKEMRHGLSLVINSHRLRNELIKKGEARVKEFSWQKAAERTYNILISKY